MSGLDKGCTTFYLDILHDNLQEKEELRCVMLVMNKEKKITRNFSSKKVIRTLNMKETYE